MTTMSTKQLQQHLIVLTVGTPVATANRPRTGTYAPCHQALLDELADYVAGGSRTGGASSAGRYGCRLPLSANALEVQENIRSTVIGSCPGAPLKMQVKAWGQFHLSQGSVTQALDITTAWIRAIMALRYPVHELQATCPSCGEYEVIKTNCDGATSSHLRKSALYYTVERARCRSCSATWEGLEGMKILASLLSSQD